MLSQSSNSPDEAFFNDLSQQPPSETQKSQTNNEANGDVESRTKQKRIACVLCRRRKLKCDGCRPTCGTCNRLSHECTYDEVRKKSGPKRGYVKALEARLHQVETLLKTQEPEQHRQDPSTAFTMPQRSSAGLNLDSAQNLQNHTVPSQETVQGFNPMENGGETPFPWEMIGLGLDEPLPMQEVQNELHQIYFEKVHTSVPMIHRPRYLAAMNLAPHMRPPVCLRYIMWCLAASLSDKYDGLQEHFYHRARKYAQMDEMKGHGESTITVAHCQAWVLITTYEFKLMYFPRAWMSAGRAVRLAQMMQLHRLDGQGLDVKQCLPPPKDWIEKEERRRTFWMTFCEDRYASIGTGWPMAIEERDILTNLPASDDAFLRSKPVQTGTLEDALNSSGIPSISAFAGVVLMACLFGRNLLHLHRPTPDDQDHDLNGEFWKRHRRMDSILLNTSLALPDNLRLPAGLPDANTVFLNMNIHTSAICLHQAAIYKADKHRLPLNVSQESKIRCVTAAAEIASIMKMISHLDLSSMNPFISFCLYVAARVFVQYLKSRPGDQQISASLQFLLNAMRTLKRKNPLTESFLVQLDVDLEGAGLPASIPKTPFWTKKPMGEIPVNTDSVACIPLMEIRESQSSPQEVRTFGGQGILNANLHQQGSSSMGPPFHVTDINAINVDVDSTQYGFAAGSPHMDLPNRQRGPSSTSQSSMHPQNLQSQPSFIHTDSEMDTSPDASGGDQATPSTDGHRGPSSHSSFTPPNNEDSQQQHQHFTTGLSQASSSHPVDTTTNNNTFFSNPDEDFSSIAAQFFPSTPQQGEAHSNEFIMQSGVWEGPSMTPIGDTAWGTILDMNSWESMGQTQIYDTMGRRVQ